MRMFLFDRTQFIYLGELSFAHGKMSTIVLSADGERRLGATVAVWQTQGVAATKDVVAGERQVLVEYMVQTRSSQFMSAVTDWALREQLIPMHVPDQMIGAWEKIIALPFTAHEQLLFLRALCRAPASDMKAWNGILDEALKATQKA